MSYCESPLKILIACWFDFIGEALHVVAVTQVDEEGELKKDRTHGISSFLGTALKRSVSAERLQEHALPSSNRPSDHVLDLGTLQHQGRAATLATKKSSYDMSY